MEKIKSDDLLAKLKAYEGYFSDSKLMKKLEKVGKSVGATMLYPTFLLYNLLKSGEVNFAEKAAIIGALGYFIFPADLIPDAWVGVGYTDDMAALMAVLTALAANLSDPIQQAAKDQLKNILGEFDERALSAVSKIIARAHKSINKE